VIQLVKRYSPAPATNGNFRGVNTRVLALDPNTLVDHTTQVEENKTLTTRDLLNPVEFDHRREPRPSVPSQPTETSSTSGKTPTQTLPELDSIATLQGKWNKILATALPA
jgi:hypothetical protein